MDNSKGQKLKDDSRILKIVLSSFKMDAVNLWETMYSWFIENMKNFNSFLGNLYILKRIK